MSLFEIIKMRYLKVFYSITEDYIAKCVVSAVIYLLALFGNIFETNAELVALLFVAVMIDWVTGNLRAKREKKPILSFGWRQTIVKVIEYAVFLSVLTGIANVFGETEIQNWIGNVLVIVKNLDWFGYFYLTITELKSVAENLSNGNKGKFSKIIEFIKHKFNAEDFDI